MIKRLCLLGAEGLLYIALGCSKIGYGVLSVGRRCTESAEEIIEGVRYL